MKKLKLFLILLSLSLLFSCEKEEPIEEEKNTYDCVIEEKLGYDIYAPTHIIYYEMTASEIEQIEKAGTYIIDYTLNYGDLVPDGYQKITCTKR